VKRKENAKRKSKPYQKKKKRKAINKKSKAL